MSNPYSEDSLIQEAAANLLHDELEWETVFAFDNEVLGENGTLGRTSHMEVILLRYLRSALRKFNTWLTQQQEEEAIKKIKNHVSTASRYHSPAHRHRAERVPKDIAVPSFSPPDEVDGN